MLAAELLCGVLRRPLERCVRLGHKVGNADGNVEPSALSGTFVDPHHIAGDLGDAVQVLVGFPGETDHEIELDMAPAQFQGLLHCSVDVFFCDSFIDNVTEPLSPRLRGKGQSGLFVFLDLLQHVKGEAVQPEGRQGKGNLPLLAVSHQGNGQFFEAGIVTGGQ